MQTKLINFKLLEFYLTLKIEDYDILGVHFTCSYDKGMYILTMLDKMNIIDLCVNSFLSTLELVNSTDDLPQCVKEHVSEEDLSYLFKLMHNQLPEQLYKLN